MVTGSIRVRVFICVSALVNLIGISVTCAQSPGSVDSSFAGVGYLSTTVGAPGSVNLGRALVLQPDGRIVVGGSCDGDFCLVRYLTDGTLDTSFGTGGKVIQSLVGTDNAYAMALQQDGKFVMAGNCINGLSSFICAARFTTAGALDTSFGAAGTGWLTINPGSLSSRATAIALQPDGKILLAGGCTYPSTSEDFCVVRLNSNGTLDTTFNSTGSASTSFAVTSVAQRAQAIAVQTDGKIVVAGYCDSGTYDRICVARFLSNGSALDGTFGGTGYVTTAALANVNNRAYSAAILPNGKIVVGGECGTTGCAVRYLPDGSLDTSFGTGGVVGNGGTAAEGYAGAIALDVDGGVFHAGWNNPVAGIDFRLVRRWSSNGKSEVAVAHAPPSYLLLNSSSAYLPWMGIALQTDGKIVVAGSAAHTSVSTDTDFFIARYNGFPNDARNCSLDVDGDGSIVATVDTLIHARVALGVTGNAVVSGIAFAPQALRKTWTDIRNYLVSQCGMSLP